LADGELDEGAPMKILGLFAPILSGRGRSVIVCREERGPGGKEERGWNVTQVVPSWGTAIQQWGGKKSGEERGYD